MGPFPMRYCQYFSMGLAGFRRGRAHSWQAFLGANKRVPHGPHTTKAVPQATRSFPVHTVPSLKRAPCLQHLRSSCWVGSRNAKNTVRGSGQGWGTRHSDGDPSPKNPLFWRHLQASGGPRQRGLRDELGAARAPWHAGARGRLGSTRELAVGQQLRCLYLARFQCPRDHVITWTTL